jgi:hypothetical protein
MRLERFAAAPVFWTDGAYYSLVSRSTSTPSAILLLCTCYKMLPPSVICNASQLCCKISVTNRPSLMTLRNCSGTLLSL